MEVVRELSKSALVTVLHAPTYGGLSRLSAAAASVGEVAVRSLDTTRMMHALSHSNAEPLRDAIAEAGLALARVDGLCEQRFDVAYIQDYACAPVAAALLQAGSVGSITAICHLPLYAGFTYFARSLTDDLHQRLEALLVRLSARVVVPSTFTRSVLLRTYSLSPSKVEVIALAAERTCPIVDRAPGHPLRVGCVARFTEQKGLHYLPSLLEHLATEGIDVRLCLLCNGPGRQRFEQLIKSASRRDKIEISGSAAPDAVWAFYDKIDVFVSTSLYETFGLAPLEAMASGRPALAFDLPALRELFGPLSTQALVPLGDVRHLAARIAEVSDPARWRADAAAARSRASNFSWRRHVSLLVEGWRGAIS